MTPDLRALLDTLAGDPAFEVVWAGAMSAVVRHCRTHETRNLGNLRQLYVWQHGHTPTSTGERSA